jgi:hypothetical protein
VFTYGDPDAGFMGGGVTDAAIPFPDRGWGITARFTPNDLIYLTGGVQDANADVTKLDFHSLRHHEYFYALEAGITPGFGIEGSPVGLYSLLFWQRDGLAASNDARVHGFAISAQQEIGPNNDIVPFARYSFSSGSTASRHHVAAGVVFEEAFGKSDDVIGLAGAWAQPSDTTKRDEYSFEAFYRIFITPFLAITPDVQIIFDPSNTSDYDTVVVGSLRARLVF